MSTKSVFVILIIMGGVSALASAQGGDRFPGTQSLGILLSYSPTSDHILIGTAQQRRIFTAGAEYTHRFWRLKWARFDYTASANPFYRESDPTLVATETEILGYETVTPVPRERVAIVSKAPIGYSCVGSGPCSPVYPVYGKDEQTYGVELMPAGVRAAFMPQRRLQPTFGASIGTVLSTRDLPVDDSAPVNYEFTVGPGAQVFFSRRVAVRVEYLYRHISNADLGASNPGIDQGLFRICLSRYR